MAQERQHSVADEVHRRLVAGHEEEDAHGQQLALRQPITLLLGRDERAQQIRPGLPASLGYLGAEVLGQRLPRLHAALLDLHIGLGTDGVKTARQVGRPLSDRGLITDGHPQHLADHRDGQRIGQVLDDVHRARRHDAIQEPVHDVLDMRAHRLHHARSKRLVHQGAQARVVGWILEEHRRRQGSGLAARGCAAASMG